jgi:methyltransferase
MLIRFAVCAGMAAARLAELAYSRRNVATSGETRERPASRTTYPLIVAVHVLAIAGTLLRGGKPRFWPWLALLLAVQPLRVWVIATLGQRWNTRAAVPTVMVVETGGPYRFVRHPNYSVIGVELLALPMAFGLPRLALLVSVANAALLAARIREEEAALRQLSGYTVHFERKKRFIPGLF